MSSAPVAVVMGSDSDLRVMRAAIEVLGEFGIAPEVRILSAHRTPAAMLAWAETAADRGTRVIIAGAGGAAHLPGMIAAATSLPVIGVPVAVTALNGMDALLSIVQMPAGVPVATMAIDGARNAGLFAVRILAASNSTLRAAMANYQAGLAEMVVGKDRAVQAEFAPDAPGSGDLA